MKETIADVSSASPSSELALRSDEGLALETSAIVSFTAFHYPHQHTVDTPVCLPPRRRSQPSSLKSWRYTELFCSSFCALCGFWVNWRRFRRVSVSTTSSPHTNRYNFAITQWSFFAFSVEQRPHEASAERESRTTEGASPVVRDSRLPPLA